MQFAYAFRVFRAKPYYDQYHEYLDYFLSIVNIGTIALSMLHYNKPSIAGELITALIQVTFDSATFDISNSDLRTNIVLISCSRLWVLLHALECILFLGCR